MPWKEVSPMDLRSELLLLMLAEGANISELCRRFGVSRKTAYKWLARHRKDESARPSDRSRRPHGSPGKTEAAVERQVLAVRERHPAWGGRKIRAWLLSHGCQRAPSASTITMILHRHGLVSEAESLKRVAFVRFERESPNELWQMDFKGHFAMGGSVDRCHPLTVLDDHSRYLIGIRACGQETIETVQRELTVMFRRVGLPQRMLMDNGAPFGDSGDQPYTRLGVWLMRNGIGISHGRPRHPQTQGKAERFHRTLLAEAITGQSFRDLSAWQAHLDGWRELYNFERPHEALQMATPSSRYRMSERSFVESLPAIEYSPGDVVRKVQDGGLISYRGVSYRVGGAFKGHPVGLRATRQDGLWDVYFCQSRIGRIDERLGPGSGLQRGSEEAEG